MRVILLSVGSRGDAEPYCALSKKLLQRPGFEVDMFVQSNLKYLANPYRDCRSFRLFSFPFESKDFYRVAQASPSRDGLSHPDPRMQHVEAFAEIVGELVLPCLPQVLEVVDDSEKSQECIIVTSAFTRSIAFLIGRARRIPIILLHLQPLLPNRLFPSYRTTRTCFVNACTGVDLDRKDKDVVGQEQYEETYWKIEHALEEFFLKARLERISVQCFGEAFIPPSWNSLQKMLTGKDEFVWIANAYSNHLVPTLVGSAGVGPRVFDVGPLADGYVGDEHEELDRTIHDFFNSSPAKDEEKPICIGFGSMPYHNIDVILQALKILQMRAILVGHTFLRIPESHPAIRHKRILCISAAAYPLLLPKCSMMICHGGVGVVQACLRAGVPCLISPLMGDQFAWAQLVEAKGYGVQCGSKLSELSVDNIIHAVEGGKKCRGTCRRLGLRVRLEPLSGVERLSELISAVLTKNSAIDPSLPT